MNPITFHITGYTRLHLIEQIMVLRNPPDALRYRVRLCRAPLARLQKLNRILMP